MQQNNSRKPTQERRRGPISLTKSKPMEFSAAIAANAVPSGLPTASVVTPVAAPMTAPKFVLVFNYEVNAIVVLDSGNAAHSGYDSDGGNGYAQEKELSLTGRGRYEFDTPLSEPMPSDYREIIRKSLHRAVSYPDVYANRGGLGSVRQVRKVAVR